MTNTNNVKSAYYTNLHAQVVNNNDTAKQEELKNMYARVSTVSG